jgi:hypothetical protein
MGIDLELLDGRRTDSPAHGGKWLRNKKGADMDRKKNRKTKSGTANPVKTLPVKTIHAKDARDVRGGKVSLHDIHFTSPINKPSP